METNRLNVTLALTDVTPTNGILNRIIELDTELKAKFDTLGDTVALCWTAETIAPKDRNVGRVETTVSYALPTSPADRPPVFMARITLEILAGSVMVQHYDIGVDPADIRDAKHLLRETSKVFSPKSGYPVEKVLEPWRRPYRARPWEKVPA